MPELRSGGRRLTLRELTERSARAAAGFESLGIGPGSTVVICLRNDFAFLEATLALGQIGAYAVPINWHCTAEEARYLLTDAGPQALLIHADLLGPIRDAIPEGVRVLVVDTPPELRTAYGIADIPSLPAATLNWNDWLADFAPRSQRPVQSPGSIMYTSGTTGRAKGVRRFPPTPEQANRISSVTARAFGFAPYLDKPDSIFTVITGPLYHNAPNFYASTCCRIGANVILQPRYDAEELLRIIETDRITHLHMVPVMFNRLLKLPEDVRRRYDVSSLRAVAHAAAPVSPEVKRAMIDWWGPVINEYYGSTETHIITFCTSEEWLAHPGTVGRPLPESVVRVIDAQGRTLPAGSVGEVVGRLAGIADFTYHGDDLKRSRAEKFGLIAPGDVGYLDQDGFLHLCDRTSDMVISGGVNIYPAEIESELQKMPGVVDCAVFGIPDDEFGEALCVMIQPQANGSLTSSDVRSYLRARMAGYKVPKYIEFRSDLPREDSGKIFKRKLRQPYWASRSKNI